MDTTFAGVDVQLLAVAAAQRVRVDRPTVTGAEAQIVAALEHVAGWMLAVLADADDAEAARATIDELLESGRYHALRPQVDRAIARLAHEHPEVLERGPVPADPGATAEIIEHRRLQGLLRECFERSLGRTISEAARDLPTQPPPHVPPSEYLSRMPAVLGATLLASERGHVAGAALWGIRDGAGVAAWLSKLLAGIQLDGVRAELLLLAFAHPDAVPPELVPTADREKLAVARETYARSEARLGALAERARATGHAEFLGDPVLDD